MNFFGELHRQPLQSVGDCIQALVDYIFGSVIEFALRGVGPLSVALNLCQILCLGLRPHRVRDHLHRLVIGHLGNLVNERFHFLHLQGHLRQFLFFLGKLLLLLGDDKLLLFQIGPTAILRLLVKMEAMLLGNLKKQFPANRVKGLLTVVVSAFGLVRLRTLNTQGLQRLILLGAKLAVLILTVKNVPLMDMGSTLVQMECPIQNVNVSAEAFFKFLIKLADHPNENFRGHRFFYRADLEDGFLRAGLFVLEQLLNRAVALRVPRLLISGILSVNEITVMLQIVGVFDLLKTEIRRVAVLSGLHGGHAPIAVPIDVLHDPRRVDVFAVLHIEAAVIVPWVVGSVFAGTPVVSCQLHVVFPPLLQSSFSKKGGEAASACYTKCDRQYPVRAVASDNSPWAKGFHPLDTGAGVATLHPTKRALPS